MPASEAGGSEVPTLLDDTPGDRVKTIESMRAVYKEHQQLIDEGILGAAKVLDSPQVKSLGASIEEKLEVGKADPETIKLAGELAELDAFAPMKVTAAKTGVTTVGIGAALSVMKGLGVEAGAECTFQTQESNISYRAWALLSTGPDSSASLGVNLSIWFTRPVVGAMSGGIIDLTVKGEYPVAVRFSFICQRDNIGRGSWTDPSAFSAIALRIGAGKATQVSIPNFPVPPGLPVVIGLAGYYGYQWAPPQRPGITKATLTVVDANGTGQIIIGAEPKNLNATLTPPSAPPYTLVPNASSMAIALPDWVNTDLITFSGLTGWSTPQYNAANDNFVSTYQGTQAPWGPIKFVIQNVQANSAKAQAGLVSLVMNINPDNRAASPTSAPLTLVAEQGSISFNWSILMPASFKLAPDQSASGENVVLYTAATPNVLQKMSGVIDALGTQWDLDVIYEFATDPITGKTSPMVQAMWQQTGKPQKSAFQYPGNPAYITSSAVVTSTAYYNTCNLPGNPNCPQFQITATPLDASS